MTTNDPPQPPLAWRERQTADIRKRLLLGMLPGMLALWGVWIAYQFFGFDPFANDQKPVKNASAADPWFFFAAVFIATAVALLFAWWWMRRITNLYQNGVAVSGRVVKRVIAGGGLVRLRCGYEVAGKQYTKDHPFPAAHAEEHERGKPILIFVSPSNPRRALIATSFDE